MPRTMLTAVYSRNKRWGGGDKVCSDDDDDIDNGNLGDNDNKTMK